MDHALFPAEKADGHEEEHDADLLQRDEKCHKNTPINQFLLKDYKPIFSLIKREVEKREEKMVEKLGGKRPNLLY
ncbi:hypothetical protein ME792_13360 [Lactobacillus delbrueckii]|nr:hypothetical protein ME792_13360 [Lactobacillus delbrueckii]